MDALGGLYAPTRQPNNPPNHSRKQKEPPSAKATSKFFKTKRQYFDYAKRSIFDFNGIGGQFTIEATKIDSMSKYVMSNNEIKQACSFIRQKRRIKKWEDLINIRIF